MAESQGKLTFTWAESVKNDPNALVREKEITESECSNDDSNALAEKKERKESGCSNDDSNAPTEEKKIEESDSSEDDPETSSEEEGSEADRKEVLQLEEELTKLAVAVEDKQAKAQATKKALQDFRRDIRAASTWLRTDTQKFKSPSRKTMEIVGEVWTETRLKVLEIGKREEIQFGPLHFGSETIVTPRAIDASHNNDELKPRKDPLKCFYCHEEGHFRRECPQRSSVKRGRERGKGNRGRRGRDQSLHEWDHDQNYWDNRQDAGNQWGNYRPGNSGPPEQRRGGYRGGPRGRCGYNRAPFGARDFAERIRQQLIAEARQREADSQQSIWENEKVSSNPLME